MNLNVYIVNPTKYELVTTIVDEEYIPHYGPMYVFSNDSIIYLSIYLSYSDNGCLCQISMMNGKYKISFKTKVNENDLYGN